MSETFIAEDPPSAPPRRRYRAFAIVLGAALVVQLAVVLAAPFWAPSLLPVLPWGGAPDAKLAQRIDRLETARDQERQATTQQTASLDQLGRRIAALEAKQGEQQQAAAKATFAQQQLESRIAALEAAQKREQQSVAGTASNLKQLDSRVAALEAGPQPTKDLADLRQQLESLSSANTALSGRVDALEKTARAEPATNPGEATLALALSQIHDAIQIARPFVPEYWALTALTRNRPEIAEVAATLAEPARTGVATRAVLLKRLHELAGSIANAQTPPVDTDWASEALSRLSGLVTIRRVGGPRQSGPEAAVNTAEAALTAGDLAAAVAALEKLTGAPAEAAGPWLQTAHARLTVEDALQRIEKLLVARLGKPSDADASAGPAR